MPGKDCSPFLFHSDDNTIVKRRSFSPYYDPQMTNLILIAVIIMPPIDKLLFGDIGIVTLRARIHEVDINLLILTHDNNFDPLKPQH